MDDGFCDLSVGQLDSGMIEKILVILLVVGAVAGLVWHLRKQQKTDACSGCEGCSLRQQCTKPQNTQNHATDVVNGEK